MIIIGVDFHPEFQQIASVDTDTGEFQEKRLSHREEGEEFYRALAGRKVQVGMEASGHARWFERLLADRRCCRDTDQAGAQTEDRPAGCATDFAIAGGRSFSADLGSEWGEPGSAATALASPSNGAGAHAHHEPAASRRLERRPALEKEVVAGTWSPATGSVSLGALGQPAKARSARVTRSTEPHDRRVEPGDRTGSRKVP
jgi:hypothetical protein